MARLVRILVNDIEVRIAREEDRSRAERLGRLLGEILGRGTGTTAQEAEAGGSQGDGRRA